MSTVPHYNAFISYRHHPQDIAVAEAIHRGLERFKIPRALKKQGKSIDRIFRDKEELPITSSLTDTITQALEHSDFQIVICSTHLKDSYWVQREIEAFLQTHTKDQILTVIVDGEPQDVIPEILTYREVTDPVTGITVRQPLEPLSCDWRLPKREAMKKELPRLAAVLLGCTYNDLMQRQKQYQMQRMAAGFSVALAISMGFGAYFLHSSIRIQENLNQALRNQSQYLASTAQSVYENGDRLTAIALALEALPTAENQRPYVIEAERALSDALMLYQPKNAFIATAAFTARQTINCFALSPDGSILYTHDSHSDVAAWDTDSGAQLGSIYIESTLYRLDVDIHNNLVVENGGSSTIQCYAPNGSLLWQREDVSNFVLTKDGSTILALHTELGKPAKFMVIDPADGSLTHGPVTLPISDLRPFSGRLNGTDYYVDRPIPMEFSKSVGDVTYNICATYDVTTGAFTQLLETQGTVIPFTTLPDGKVLVPEDTTENLSGDLSDWRECTTALHCYASDGRALWTTFLTGYRTGRVQMAESIPNSNDILVQYDSGLYVLSGSTGQILSQCIAPEFPLAVEPSSDGATVIFQDGSVVWFDYATGGIHQTSYKLDANPETVQINRGIYITKDLSPTVLRYTSAADDSYQVVDTLDGIYLNLYTDDVAASDTHMAVIAKNTLRLYDLTGRSLMWSVPWSVGDGELLGFSEASGKLYARSDTQVFSYDIATGKETVLDFPVKFWYHRGWALAGDHLYYLDISYRTEDKLYVVDWNLAENTHTILKSADYMDGRDGVICYGNEQYLLFRTEAGRLKRFTLADGTCGTLIKESPKYPVFLAEPETGNITLAADGEIRTLDAQLNVVQSFPLPDITPASLFRYEDRLLVLADDEIVYVFDGEGNLEKRYELAVYENFFNHTNLSQSLAVPITWSVTGNGEVFVNVFGAGNILPMDESMPRYHLENTLHFDPTTNRIYCYAENGESILSYSLLSTEEVIARGKETLGSFTLTPDQRTAYGLGQ